MRIRGYDEETEEFKDDVEELSGAIADLTKTAKHPGGVSLFRDAAKTEFKSTYEVLRDISNIYDELTDKQQAQVLEKLAGKRGGQVLAGILSPEKFKEVERALQEMENAAGAADAEMGIVEESIQFKLNALQQTWVGILQELVDRGTIGNLIDALTKISEGVANITKNTDALKVAIGAVIGASTSLMGKGIFSGKNGQFGLNDKGLGGLLSSIIGTTPTISKDLSNQIASTIRSSITLGTYGKDTLSGFGLADEEIDKLHSVVTELDAVGKAGQISGKQVSKAFVDSTVAANGFKAAVATLGATLANIAISMAVTWIIGRVVEAFDRAVHAFEYAEEEFDKTKSNIESLNAELKTTQDRISELQAKGSLTFVEQDELNKLQKANELLELQIANEKKSLEIAKKNLDRENENRFDRKYAVSAEKVEAIYERGSGAGDEAYDPIAYMLVQRRRILEDLQTTEGKEFESYQQQLDDIDGQIQDKISDLLNMLENAEETGNTTLEKRIKESLTTIYSEIGETSAWNSNEFNGIFNNKSIEKTKDELIELAKAGELNIDEFPNLKQAIDNADFIGASDKVAAFKEQLMALWYATEQGQNYLGAKKKFGATKYDDRGFVLNGGSSLFDSWIDNISPDEYDIVNSEDFAAALSDITAKTNGLVTSTNQYDEALQRVKEHRQQIAEENAEFSAQDFSENLTSKLSKVQSAYESFYQNVVEGEQKAFDLDSFEALRADLVKNETDEHGNKNPYGLSEDEFNRLEEIITNSTYSIEEQKKAWDDLGTALANIYWNDATKGMTEIDEKSKQLVKDQLELRGYTKESIDKYVEARSNLPSFGEDIKKSLKEEYAKIDEYGLSDYAESIKNKTIQKVYGNVDMDKRAIITWSKELKDTYKKELESWNYDPEIGGIDTVFGGSDAFKIGNQDIEVAYTPIIEVDDHAELLGKETVDKYIQDILDKASEDKNWNISEILALDKEGINYEEYDEQGRLIGHTLVRGIIAGAGEGAIDIGSLLHFSGEDGAIEIAERQIQEVAAAEQRLQELGIGLEQVTVADITALKLEGTVSEETAAQLNQYAIQRQLINGTPISSGDDVAALYALAVEAGVAKEDLIALEEVMAAFDYADSVAANGHLGAAEKIRKEAIEKQKDAINRVSDELSGKLEKDLDKIKNKIKGAGGAAKDASEDTVDVLSKINSQIDEIQDSYQKLEKIQESYNSTGKISIDQAQELSNMDFRYLAQLDLTTGALDLQKDAWDKLTEAKINDLKIAMIQKALDLISTFKNEAVAIEYLGNSYIDAANKALTLAQAQAQVAEMNLGENGQKAADAVMRGLENALAMIDHVDLNLHTESGSERESGGGGHEPSGKTPEQEAFEEEVKEAEEKLQITYKDWMEVALDKVSKKVDKWTQSIDKVFSFWNKQWASNRALKAIHEEIDLQQAAQKLYMKQASKAAKKAGRYINKNDEELTYEILGTEDLTKVYKKLIQNGKKKIETFDGSQKAKTILDKISAYEEWYNKAIAAQEKITELYDQERQILKDKLDSIVSYFDKIDSYLNSFIGKIDARISMKNAAGQKTSLKDLMEKYAETEKVFTNRQDELYGLSTGKKRDKDKTSDEIIADAQKQIDEKTISNNNYKEFTEAEINSLKERQEEYNSLMQKISQTTDKKTKKDLKKKAKKLKLNKSEEKLLSNLEDDIASIDNTISETLTDRAVTETAMYQQLVNKITKLQSKKKLSKKNSKKLDMYLDELNAINQGIMAEDLTDYMKNYEQYWKLQNKLDTKGKLSTNEQLKLNNYKKNKEEYEKKFTDYYSALDKDKEDAEFLKSLESMSTDEQVAAYEKRAEEKFEEDKKAIEDSYNEEIQNISDSYLDNSSVAKLIKQRDKLQAKGDLSKKEEDKLEKLNEEIEAFIKGATDSNIKEYKKTWERWYKLSHKKKRTDKENAELDKLSAKLDAWVKDKQDQITNLTNQRDDAVDELQIDTEQQMNETASGLYETAEAIYSLAKEVSEFTLNTIKQEIDELNQVIDQYRNVASILENTPLANIQKYKGLSELLGINGNDVAKILDGFYAKEYQAIDDKLNKETALGQMYTKLIQAGSKEEWEKIITASEGVSQETVDKLINRLKTDEMSPDEWVAEWKKGFNEWNSEIASTFQNEQELFKLWRENVYFKAIQNAINQMDLLSQKTSSLTSLFRDEWMFDSEGITEFGRAKAKSLLDEYALAEKQLENYANNIDAINKAWNDGKYNNSEEEYQKDLLSAQKTYTDGLRQQEDLWVQIADISKKVQEEDINQIKKAADAYQKALQNKKAYWQYSQNIKSKTKEIEALRAEIDALNGVNTAEAKALEAQKQAALEAAQEELENMQMEHAFDLSADALNKFVENLESSLDTSTQKIAETFEDIIENFGKTVELAKTADIASALNTITHAMSDGSVNTTVTKIDTPDSSASSSVTIPEDSLSINQYVRMDEETFINSLKTSLTDTVTPKLNTINNSLSSISTLLQKSSSTAWIQKIHDTLAKQIQPSISDISEGLLKNGATGNVTVNISYDSLMTVNGSVDSTVVSNMNKMITDLISKTKDSIYKDLRKNGINITY